MSRDRQAIRVYARTYLRVKRLPQGVPYMLDNYYLNAPTHNLNMYLDGFAKTPRRPA